MYSPLEAKKTYATLLRERGVTASWQSAALMASWYFFNVLVHLPPPSSIFLFINYLLAAAYFTWKPKLIRFLRGHLRGKEWRDKGG